MQTDPDSHSLGVSAARRTTLTVEPDVLVGEEARDVPVDVAHQVRAISSPAYRPVASALGMMNDSSSMISVVLQMPDHRDRQGPTVQQRWNGVLAMS
jgi:hypothetical protein